MSTDVYCLKGRSPKREGGVEQMRVVGRQVAQALQISPGVVASPWMRCWRRAKICYPDVIQESNLIAINGRIHIVDIYKDL